MTKSLKHLTERAAEYSNIADSLDYELRGKRKRTWDGRWIMARRERVIRATQQSILDGTFSPRLTAATDIYSLKNKTDYGD